VDALVSGETLLECLLSMRFVPYGNA